MPTQSQNPEKFKNLTTMQKMSIELEDFKVIIKNIAEENNNIKEKYNAIKEESEKKTKK